MMSKRKLYILHTRVHTFHILYELRTRDYSHKHKHTHDFTD